MVAVPRLVIAAPASGSGKTTVACGLMAALRAAGLAVSGHKAGPDYIDPGYHVLATGRPARNLDPFLCGEDRIVPLFRHGARGADVAVIEGVMGLFDGACDQGRGEGAVEPGFGSTAHVARLLGAPIVLVIDAAAMGRSAGAVAAGFAGFDPGTTVAGVILNRVASDRHERLLRDGLAAAGLPVYGAIRRSDQVAAPSRHLGLIPAAERSRAATDAVARLAGLVRDSCDLGVLLALARSAPPLPGRSWEPAEALAEAPARSRPTYGAPRRRPRFTGPAFTNPACTSPDVTRHGPGDPPDRTARWSRWREVPPSRSAIPSTPNCSPRPVSRWRCSTRCATSGCPGARPGSSWAAASRRSTPPSCPPTSRCAATWPAPPPAASPSPRSAPACSTWRAPSTATPCAGSSPRRRP